MKQLYAIEPIELNEEIGTYKIEDKVEIFEDTSNNLTIDDSKVLVTQNKFIKNNKKIIFFGFSDHSFWIHFAVTIPKNNKSQWFLAVRNPTLDLVEFHYPDDNGNYLLKRTGDTFDFNNREYPYTVFVFKLSDKQNVLHYFIKIKSNGLINTEIIIRTEKKLISGNSRLLMLAWIMYGFVITLIIINIIAFIINRNKLFLYYILILSSILIWSSINDGSGLQFFWNKNVFIQNLAPFFGFISLGFASLFWRSIFESYKIQYINKIFFSIFLFNIIIAIISLTIHINVATRLTSLNSVITLILFLYTGIIFYKKNIKESVFLFIYSGIALIQTVGILLFYWGITSSRLIFHFGGVIHNLFFLFAIIYKMNSIQKEKLTLQLKATESLELKVNERTEELKLANEKLKELDKVKTNFFANISHEIRTPLTLILSPIESALQGDYKKDLNTDFLKNLQRNALRLLKLINNLLDFSKLEAGRMKVHVQEFDLVQFMKNYISSVQSAFDTKKINISFMSFNNEVKLFLDLEKMDKIIMNLFSNALKFTDRGGEIKIRIKDDDRYCYIEYEDNGIGIPSDTLHRIFDRFSQADSSSTRKHEGTGIGLALAKELVEMHKGEIKVQSRFKGEFPDNHGTTFTVTFLKGIKHFDGDDKVEIITNTELEDSVSDHRFLGLRELEDQKETEVTGEQVVCDDKPLVNVLIVEDNPDMRNFIKMLLEDKYCIHTAVNGEEGLNRIREIKPDLIISDVMMPIMNGYEMTQKIKEDDALKLIPVLMLTAKAEIANKIEGLEYGADDYLTKPFNSKELLTRIKSLLKLKEMQNQLLDLNRNLAGKVEEQLALIMRGDELKRYLPPQLVDSIIKGEKQVTFETERKKLTIFFSDIKGFTETTDGMEPEELSALLNEYLTEMTKIAHKWGGTIDKFIGDAIMIFYGAPIATDDKDHALRCVKMAIEMQIKMKELQKKWLDEGIEYPLSIRIGINTGTATVGNFGAEDRLSYTAIGGQVNLASRLEGLAEPGGILISHPVYANVKDEINCRQRDEKVKVKGISREIIVYDVVTG